MILLMDGIQKFMKKKKMKNDVEVAKLLNKVFDNETGRLLITFEITDPVLKSKLIRENIKLRLVIEEE